jgi:GNAT superfamily N-acetyltransferase
MAARMLVARQNQGGQDGAMTGVWRQAHSGDVMQIAAISAAVLSDYPEEPPVFEELVRLAPTGCHVHERDGAPCGYVLSHPWVRSAPPALNTRIGALPDRPDCWYIHDLGLLPQARGHGAAGAGVELVGQVARAAGIGILSIVAVNGAAGFWKRQGFSPLMDAAMVERIASYGDDALYMERRL